MATHDYNIANGTGAAVRADINNALAAIQSTNSNSSAPSTTVAFQLWADTSSGTLKIRNAANSAFIELMQLDGTMTMEDGSASSPGLAFRDDLNTGIFSSAADKFNIATGGVERMELGTTTIFNEDGADVDFRIEGDTDANLFYVDAGNNRIGIGTNAPATALDLRGDLTITSTAPFINFIDSDNNDDFNIQVSGGNFAINNTTDGLSNLVINSDGKVGIGVTAPSQLLHLKQELNATNSGTGMLQIENTRANTGSGAAAITFRTNEIVSGFSAIRAQIAAEYDGANNVSGRLVFLTVNSSGSFQEVMRLDDSGLVGIGTSSPVNKLEVDNGSSVCFARISTTNTGSGVAGLIIANSTKSSFNDGIKIKHGAGIALVTGLDDSSICRFSPQNGASGNFHVFGALSKGSGSFLIDHPLESKKDTHNLVHSFIEGPQADLIYRGKIALSEGSATVNIDTVSGMTSGTFATLNTNVQCFTNNETGWSAVKGSVSGNILTITAEDNSCSDTISWLVIGERQDQHMKETTWTDNDGKVIVEPLKD